MVTNWKNKQQKTVLMYTYFEALINRKREAGNHSTADLYRAVNNWLSKFTKGYPLMLREITPNFVENFSSYLQSLGYLTTNTIVTYISNFRAMYNTAIRDRIIHPKFPPFANLSFRKEMTAKRAISRKAIENICQLNLQQEPDLAMSADLCIFSFLACGIPFVDLAHLTKDNIIEEDIIYNRIKTGTTIRIRITEGMRRLLNKYEGQNGIYLFPILKKGTETLHEEYKALLHTYNNDLKEIGNRLEIPVHLTSYVIRHTWATEALKQHIPIAIISQALGHTSERTTRYYLDQLDQSELNNANILIIGSVDCIAGIRA